jgi:hypothetical protein
LLQTPKNVVRPASVVENSDVITNIPRYTEQLKNNSDSDQDSLDSEVLPFESRIDNKSSKKNKRKKESVDLKSQKKKRKSNSKSKKKEVNFSEIQNSAIDNLASNLMNTAIQGLDFNTECSKISNFFTKLAINILSTKYFISPIELFVL